MSNLFILAILNIYAVLLLDIVWYVQCFLVIFEDTSNQD